MKVVIIALIFGVVVATEKERCGSASDCGENECCAFISLYQKGRCRPLSKENDRCTESIFRAGGYYKRCPCESGLVCKPEKIIKSEYLDDVEIKINERCVNENEVTTGDGGEVTIEAE